MIGNRSSQRNGIHPLSNNEISDVSGGVSGLAIAAGSSLAAMGLFFSCLGTLCCIGAFAKVSRLQAFTPLLHGDLLEGMDRQADFRTDIRNIRFVASAAIILGNMVLAYGIAIASFLKTNTLAD